MSEKEFEPSNYNCEVAPCDINYDFSDPSRFAKVNFPAQAGIATNSLIPYLVGSETANALSQTYVMRFPEGVQGTLMKLHQGGYSTALVGDSSRFVGTASAIPVSPAAVAALNVFTLTSFATGQYFLTNITKQLTEVNKKLDEIMKFLESDKRTKLLSELSFVKYAVSNYSSIMLNEAQRIATLANIQRAKIEAVADIEFYLEQLESASNISQKTLPFDSILKQKRSIDLASQLYVLSTIMEAYYSQNWDKNYCKNILEEAGELFQLAHHRIFASFQTCTNSVLKSHKIDVKSAVGAVADLIAHKTKKPTEFKNISEDEQNILSITQSLSAETKSPLVELITNALSKPSESSEFYLCANGDIYQKL